MRALFLLLLLLPLASAQPALEGFDDAAVAPPSLPGSQASLSLVASDTGDPIGRVHIEVLRAGSLTLAYVGGDGVLNIDAGEAPTLRADASMTAGKDYYAALTQPLVAGEERIVLLHPVGSLTGEVYDDEFSLVPGAEVEVSCAGAYGEQGPTTTDRFGTFTFAWLPVGECSISAGDAARVGFAEASIAQGERAEVRIQLATRVRADDRSWVWWAFAGLVLLGLIWWGLRNRPTDEERPLPRRTRDLLETFSENERSVVEYLIANPSAYQNKVMHATQIPKTSLVRVLASLERKAVLRVRREGKVKRIELTDWFMGRSEKKG